MRVPSLASLLSFVMAIVVFASCGDNNPKTAGGPADIEAATQLVSAEGIWQGSCRNQRFEAFGVASATERLELDEKGFRRIVTLFAEDNCSQSVLEVRETGTYTLGELVAPNTRMIDARLEKVTIKPLKFNARNALNAMGACAMTDWRAGEERDVTERTTEDPLVSRCWVKTPRDVFDLVAVTGEEMRLGLPTDENDKLTAETRPTEIDPELVYKKKSQITVPATTASRSSSARP